MDNDYIYKISSVRKLSPMISSDQIEKIAVNAVETEILKSRRLSPHISRCDKEPIWDGSIYLNGLNGAEKERIPVQVKGKTVNEIPKRTTFQVEVSHLKSFLKDGGVLFFVVYISKANGEPLGIFVSRIAPVDANSYLRRVKKGQKKVSVELEPIPKDPSELERRLINFKRDCQKQTSLVEYAPTLSVAEAMEKGYVINFCDQLRDNTISSTSDGVYLYAVVSESPKVLLPVGSGRYSIKYSLPIDQKVSIGRKSYFDNYVECYGSDDKVFQFGSKFILTLRQNGTVKLSYEEQEKILEDRLKSYSFLRRISQKGNVALSLGPLQVGLFNDESRRPLKELSQKISALKKKKEVLNILGVEEEIDISDFTDQDWSRLGFLVRGLIDEKPVPIKEHNAQQVISITVSNYSFLLLVRKLDDENVRIFNFMDFAKESTVYVEKNGVNYQTSYYALFFRNEAFANCRNITFSDLVPSYRRLREKNEKIEEIAQDDLLLGLKSYDSLSSKNYKLLDALLLLSEWIVSEDEGSVSAQINRLQTVKRRRELSEAEYEVLLGLLHNNKLDEMTKVSIYLLLDDRRNAEYCFKCLAHNHQQEFLSQPIACFLDDSIKSSFNQD